MKVSERDLSTWASGIAPFAALSWKLTQPQSWLRAWKKGRWMRHLSGPMLQPSTLQHGAERWIASLPDSRAKTLASQDGEPGLMGSGADSSLKSRGSQTIAVRGSYFWRTSQASLLPPPPLWTKKKANSTNAQPPASWENWPTSGGMRNGSLFQRPMWVPAMGAQGGSVSRGALWQTPKDEEASGSGVNSRGEPKLKAQANNWATPDCNTATYSNGKFGPNLREQSTQWPTPVARDGKGVNSEEHATVTGGGRKHMDQLANFVAYSPLAQATRDGDQSSNDSPKSPRRLNPIFGAWLMGWPSTWVIAEPHASSALETALWRSALRSQLSSLCGEQESFRQAA